MKRALLFALLTGAALGAGQATAPTTSPAGLAVTPTLLRLYSAQALSPEEAQRLYPSPPAIASSLSMMALLEFSQPLGVLDPTVIVTQVTDDQGNDFTKGATAEIPTPNGIPGDIMLSPDHKSAMLRMSMAGRPAAAARTVTFKGRLSALPELGTETFTINDVPLRPGPEIKAANVVLHINSASIYGQSSHLQFRTAMADAIKNVEFFNAEGKPINTTYRDSRETIKRQNGAVEQTLGYSLDQPLRETVTLRITLYKDGKKVEIPFEITAGIGM